MKKFSQTLNSPKIVEEKFISIEEEVRSSLASKIGKVTAAAVVGGLALGGLPSLMKSGTEPTTQIQPEPQTQAQPRLVNPVQQQPKENEQQKNVRSEHEIYHDNFHKNLQNEFKEEYPVIMNAAQRNGIQPQHHERLAMLFAIRRAENGGHGKQFGVLAANAGAKKGETFLQSLDRQAGHASVGLINGEKRHQEHVASGGTMGFVEHFGKRWAPQGVANDPKNLNKHWVKNVTRYRSNFLNPPGE